MRGSFRAGLRCTKASHLLKKRKTPLYSEGLVLVTDEEPQGLQPVTRVQPQMQTCQRASSGFVYHFKQVKTMKLSHQACVRSRNDDFLIYHAFLIAYTVVLRQILICKYNQTEAGIVLQSEYKCMQETLLVKIRVITYVLMFQKLKLSDMMSSINVIFIVLEKVPYF